MESEALVYFALKAENCSTLKQYNIDFQSRPLCTHNSLHIHYIVAVYGKIALDYFYSNWCNQGLNLDLDLTTAQYFEHSTSNPV